MITLYRKDATNFENNGLGSLDKNIINPEISWKDNGAFTLEFKYPLFEKHGKEIENSSIIKCNDPEGSNLFFVYKITPSMGYVTVLCYQISYKLAFNSINDTNIVNKNGQNALNQISNATQYPHSFVFSSDILTTATSRVVRKNPIEFLLDTGLDNSFINRWGGHIVRRNFNISMNSAYGSNKGYTIRHKKDLKGYEAVFDESTVTTRIRPVGYDGLMLPEKYVDSPLINAYVEPRIQEIEYSKVKVKQKVDDEEGFSTPELAYAELRRLAKLEFSDKKVDVPNFSCKVEFVNLKDTQEYQDLKSLKQVLAGDIVKVIHAEDGFEISAQMVEYKFNPLNNSYISITLGNYSKSFTSTVSKTSNLQTNLNQIAQQAQSAMTSANGKNTVYSLSYKPSIANSSTEGDLLYLKNGDKTELWMLKLVDGKLQWVQEISDATQEELKAQMNQAKVDIVNAVDSANSAVNKANASVVAVEANTQLINDVNDLANDAKSQAQTAVNKANENVTAIEANTQLINDVNTIANNAKTQAQTATTNAQSALTNANVAKTNAQTALTNAQSALDKANGVSGKITTIETNVDKINGTLSSKANTTDVNTLTSRVSTAETNITQNANDIKTKVSTTDYNTLTGRVSQAESSITQNANAITQKVSKTDFDTLNGTVTNQATQINQNKTDIATKANQTTVNTLTGRVSQAESSITQNANAITQKVSKTDVENILTGKAYATKSELTQTSNSLTSTISGVQTNVDALGANSAFAYSADGTDRFTTTYPNLNLGDNTKTFVGAEGDNNLNGSIRIDSATQKTQDGDFNYLTFKPTRDGYDWFRFYLIPNPAVPNMTKVAVKPNTKYTFSVWLKGTGQHTIFAYQNWTAPNTPWILQVNLTSDWKIYTFTVTSSNVIPDRDVQFFIRSNNGTEINLKYPKVEEGSTATPYMPSSTEVQPTDYPNYIGRALKYSTKPSDYKWEINSGYTDAKADAQQTRVTQLSQDLSGFKTTVSSTYLSKTDASNTYPTKTAVTTQITQSATDITNSVQTWTNNKLTAYSTTQQTATSITNAVADKADKSQVTQLSNQITQKVSSTDVENILTGKAYATKSELTQTSDSLTSTISGVQLNVDKKADKTQVTQLSQDLTGFKTTVSDTYLSKTDASNTYPTKTAVASQINQKADSITSNVQTWTNDKLTGYSTIQQTATSITNAVASKADKTQITQLSNQITSVVTDVSAIQVGGQNLLLGTATAKTSTITQTNSFTTTDPYNFSASKFSAFNFEVDDYITLSFDWETTSTTGSTRPEISSTPYGFGTIISAKGTDGATSNTKTITTSEQRGHIEIVFKVSSTVKVSEAPKLRLRFDNHQLNSTFTIKNAKLEKGNKATDWCIAPQEVANQSQITQLATDINLRVSKGNVVSQINLESGKTLISSNQILLNADNVKFSGNAFIPNTVIQNLSADKINTGTLNGDNINVINLNASNIKTGTLSGTNLSMNLNSGSVQFTKGYISGNNNKIRFDLDNSYLHSLNSGGSGFKISNGQLSFYDGLLGATPQYLGAIMLDVFSSDSSGIKVYGNKGASIQGGGYGVTVGYSFLEDYKIGITGNTNVVGDLFVHGKLSVLGSKNAIHVTRDGVRATPAYETAESYLGDIGRNYTRENCEVWVEIDELFSDTVNTDIAYEVFLQAYDNARFWVADFKSDKFLVKSDKPMARFAWEIKAKRRGYENDRLVLQEGFDNKQLIKALEAGALTEEEIDAEKGEMNGI